MLNKIKEFFLGKPKAAEPAPEAPYKVEAPQASTQVKCGCGRSPSGFCVGLHSLTTEEWAVHADNPAKPAKAPAKPKAAKPAVAKKPRARKTPAK
jgi:hypothetical protein